MRQSLLMSMNMTFCLDQKNLNIPVSKAKTNVHETRFNAVYSYYALYSLFVHQTLRIHTFTQLYCVCLFLLFITSHNIRKTHLKYTDHLWTTYVQQFCKHLYLKCYNRVICIIIYFYWKCIKGLILKSQDSKNLLEIHICSGHVVLR